MGKPIALLVAATHLLHSVRAELRAGSGMAGWPADAAIPAGCNGELVSNSRTRDICRPSEVV
jgi:hypothetical protein